MNRLKNSHSNFESNHTFRNPKTPETKDDSIQKSLTTIWIESRTLKNQFWENLTTTKLLNTILMLVNRGHNCRWQRDHGLTRVLSQLIYFIGARKTKNIILLKTSSKPKSNYWSSNYTWIFIVFTSIDSWIVTTMKSSLRYRVLNIFSTIYWS